MSQVEEMAYNTRMTKNDTFEWNRDIYHVH